MSEKSFFITVKVRGVILHEGKIFLCKLAVGTQFYCLPGGTLEQGENRKEWLEREIIEELGVQPVIGDLLYTQEFVRSDSTITFDFWYEIKNSEDFLMVDISKCSHGFEHTEVGFYDLSPITGNYFPSHLADLLGEWNTSEVKFLQNM